ncbi:hypothetical protein DL764_010442 [Monosporascus ibericus]|uniref:DUF7907 domain-containing protein n=1 Tax=Monosporascus ibericus TaxID=155417 RepID=A0A4Q4STS0_9PEZI|nr:hypothetical protein DL764_010442 [Monosporascus ibericus]
MKRIIAASAALLGLALAAPCQHKSSGFNLRVKVTDPAHDLTPSVQGLYLSFQRVQQGINIAVANEFPTTYYLNQTEGGNTINHDVAPLYPVGIYVQGPDEADARYPEEHNMAVNVNDVTHGLEAFPSLSGPAAGAYLVCRREFIFPSGPAELLMPRFLYDGETLPEDCVPVAFVPECATLGNLPNGTRWNHDFVAQTSCVR